MIFLVYLVLAVVVLAIMMEIAIGLIEFTGSIFLLVTGALLWALSLFVELWLRLWKTAISSSPSPLTHATRRMH